MLTLSRKVGEQILIVAGDANITIKVLSIDYSDSTVRIGIAAPPDVNILRQELLGEEAMRRHNSKRTDR